jgi:hypothetical protein
MLILFLTLLVGSYAGSLGSFVEFYNSPDGGNCIGYWEITSAIATPNSMDFFYIEIFNGNNVTNPQTGDGHIACTFQYTNTIGGSASV